MYLWNLDAIHVHVYKVYLFTSWPDGKLIFNVLNVFIILMESQLPFKISVTAPFICRIPSPSILADVSKTKMISNPLPCWCLKACSILSNWNKENKSTKIWQTVFFLINSPLRLDVKTSCETASNQPLCNRLRAFKTQH